jgi:predicted nucleic acid-binding protein
VTVTAKLKPRLAAAEARSDVELLAAWRPVVADERLMQDAWRIQDETGWSYRDAAIVAAAVRSGCTHLLSEDLQTGRTVDGVQVTSPFETSPGELDVE